MHVSDPIKELQSHLDCCLFSEWVVTGVKIILQSSAKFLLNQVGPNLLLQLAVGGVVLGTLLVRVPLPLHCLS